MSSLSRHHVFGPKEAILEAKQGALRKGGGGLVTVAHTRDPVVGWFEIGPEGCNDELIEGSPGVLVRGSRGSDTQLDVSRSAA